MRRNTEASLNALPRLLSSMPGERTRYYMDDQTKLMKKYITPRSNLTFEIPHFRVTLIAI